MREIKPSYLKHIENKYKLFPKYFLQWTLLPFFLHCFWVEKHSSRVCSLLKTAIKKNKELTNLLLQNNLLWPKATSLNILNSIKVDLSAINGRNTYFPSSAHHNAILVIFGFHLERCRVGSKYWPLQVLERRLERAGCRAIAVEAKVLSAVAAAGRLSACWTGLYYYPA